MSTQRYIFHLHLPLEFGQYSNLGIDRIYSGTEELPAEYKKQELMEGLKLFKPLENNYEEFFQLTVDENILSVELKKEASYYKGVRLSQFDFCREVNNALSEYYFGWPLDLYNGCNLIEQYHRSYDEDLHRTSGGKIIVFCDKFLRQYNILHDGQPEYISWLINNVSYFSLTPGDLEELEKRDVIKFYGLYLKRIDDSKYEICSSTSLRKFNFSERTKILNESKWNAFWASYEDGYSASDSGKSRNHWNDGPNFNSDDDEDQIMRGLSGSNGDLFGF